MSKHKHILVSTTPTLEGWDIRRYIGPISSHVVAGVNIFSDILASLSDVFGGRSHAYQEQLSSIHDEAIEQLKRKAVTAGANCIVGLRIDHDEVSGKGKSMFMVTAVGTAVIVAENSGSHATHGENERVIAHGDFDLLWTRAMIIDRAKQGDLEFDDATWQFVIEQEVNEIAPDIIQHLEKVLSRYVGRWDEIPPHFVNQAKSFLLSLPTIQLRELLYACIPTTNDKAFQLMKDIVSERLLMEPTESIRLLDSSDDEVRRRGIILLQYAKAEYRIEDIASFQKLIRKVSAAFPDQSSTQTESKWVCGCGRKNRQDSTYCTNCDRDIYGFDKHEANLHQVSELLANTVRILKAHFEAEPSGRQDPSG